MEKLIKKLYWKNIFVMVVAMILAIILSITTKSISNIFLGILVVLYFCYNIYDIYRRYKNDEFIVLSGQCIDVEKQMMTINKNVRYEFRFLTKINGQEGFIYITGHKGQFKIGANYNLCFVKNENKGYNGTNLLVYNMEPFSEANPEG